MKMKIRAASAEGIEDGEKKLVRMSVSSELPVMTDIYHEGRYLRALEVLDHNPESIDMSRCRDGLVVLDRHGGDQIGLMQVELRDGKLGGYVEFCSGQRAQDIATDAARGLRRNVSVGYMPKEYKIEGERDGVPVARATKWMPYEASFEPVPADETVGVGRAARTENKQPETPAQTKERHMDAKQMQAFYVRASKAGLDMNEVEKIDLTDELKAERALSGMIEAKQAAEIEKLRKAKEDAKEFDKAIGGIEFPNVVKKVDRKYSVMNVIRSQCGIGVDIGLEREVSQQLEKERGSAAKGIIIPHAALAKRDFTVSGTSSASVSTDLFAGEFIDLLRTRSILGAAGVRFLTGLTGNVAIPKMTAGATGYWVAESGDITESQPTLGQVTGTPHTCGVMTDISRRLLLQSTPAAEGLVRDEIVERIIRTIQIAVFAGSGADGQPSAITTATGINNPAIASAGTPTYAEILNFPGSIEADNAMSGMPKWIMTSEVWAKLASTFTNATYGEQALANWANKTMLGYEYLLTEDVPANSLWFGDWSMVNVGVWGNGLDINVDDKTLSSSGGVRIVGLQDVDVMVRQGAALAYNTAVTA